jgi:hypothetical protein
MGSPPLLGPRVAYGSGALASVQPPSPWVYLQLQFEDPDGTARVFPENFPVILRFSPPGASPPPREKRVLVAPGGILSFPARERLADYWRQFTLRWEDANPPVIVCEPFSPPGAQSGVYKQQLSPPGAFDEPYRFFTLPKKWTMRQADWRVEDVPANATFNSPPATFSLTGTNTGAVGSPAPAKLTLLPHWHFAAFEFYDRYYGNAQLDSPPRAAVQKRISIPPVRVAGYSDNVLANPPSPPDSISNWVTSAPGKPGNDHVLQSVPFILRREEDGTVLPLPDGAKFALRFDTSADAHVLSSSETVRELKYSPPGPLGPDRLKYYDLPPTWKSWGYYARRELSSPPAPGKFFGNLMTNAEIADAEQKDKPLVFCLDDFILVKGNAGAVSGILSPPATRIGIFNHRFDEKLTSNPATSGQGLYKSWALPYGDEFELPGSDIGAIQDNYIYDYPDWTRLAVAQGSLFDIFNLRTTDAISPPGVVGARAAVCWEHADQAVAGSERWFGGGWVPNAGIMNAGLSKTDSMTARTNAGSPPWFASQRFFHQRTPRWQQPMQGDLAWQQGRYDIAFARCSDIREGNEVAVNLNYFRNSFNWLAMPASGTKELYTFSLGQNVANRWTGNDPGISDDRAWLIPRPSPPTYAAPPPPLRTNVVWFVQAQKRQRAHFWLDLTSGAGARDDRGAQIGTGHSSNMGQESRPFNAGNPSDSDWFPAAHETGHQGALPDEYNERWNAQSFNQMSFYSNLPGDPYEPDGRDTADPFSTDTSGMMNGNKTMRNRYFWPAAEWVREIINYPLSVSLGNIYTDYWLAAHPRTTDGRTYYCWPMAWSPSPPVSTPPTQNRASCDLYVYALGRDSYSANELGGADGIVVVTVRISCAVPSDPSPPVRDNVRNDVLSHLAAGIEVTMNGRFNVRGTVNDGTPQAHTFNRCAVRFQPQFLVSNYPHEASPPVVNEALTRYGNDFRAEIYMSPPLGSEFSPPNLIRVTADSNVINIDPQFAAQYPRMLGIDKSPPAVTAADLEPLIRRVMPNAVVY